MSPNDNEGSFSLTRRRFLQGVSGGAAAALIGSEAAQAQPHVEKVLPGRDRLPVELDINGSVYRVNIEAGFTLLDVLRNQLDLTGAKRVCDRAECGACTVLLEGRPVLSCTLLAIDVQGRKIQTIEGLAGDGRLHALQESFINNDAFQCGCCTSGMVMSLYGLLGTKAEPSLDQVKEAVSGNLCKCGTYQKIFRAVRDAGEALGRR